MAAVAAMEGQALQEGVHTNYTSSKGFGMNMCAREATGFDWQPLLLCEGQSVRDLLIHVSQMERDTSMV